MYFVKKRIDKKALSDIISTLLILLLVFIAVAILWVVIKQVITSGSEQISLGKFTLDLKIEQVSIDENSNNLSLKIKRNTGEGEFVGIKFIISDGDNSEIVNLNVSMIENEIKTFHLRLINLNVTNVIKVQIAPIFKLSSGKEAVGDVKDIWNKPAETPETATPETTGCIGVEECISGDGCCPPGCSLNDLDCAECISDENCTADFNSSNYCDNNNVYKTYNDYSCSNSVCVNNPTMILVQECNATQICSNRVCVDNIVPPQCTPNNYTGCDNGNVYWYDSCNVRGSLKQTCTNGCSNGVCNPPSVPQNIAWQVNQKMGRGVNAWGVVSNSAGCEMSPEWNSDYFTKIKNAGFDHVRLVIYSFRDGANYKIEDYVLSNVKLVIDNCIDAGLVAVLDYHTPLFLANPTQANQDRFVSHWGQLSNYFKDYSSEDLVFELVNEPAGPYLSASQWHTLMNNAVSSIRVHDNQRVIIVSPAPWGGLGGLGDFVLPNDNKIILSIHYYEPTTFTGQCASWNEYADQYCGEGWYDIQPIRDQVSRNFEPLIQFSQTHNVPVTIGEFGVIHDNVPAEKRARYLKYHARYFESLGWSWAVWDFFVEGSFQIYNKNTESFIPEVINALTGSSSISPAMPHNEIVLYQSNFNSGTDGWYISTSGSGSATLSVSNGELVATINNPGSEPQSISIMKNVPMYQHKMYRVKYTIRSSPSRYWMISRIGRIHTWINLFNVNPQPKTYEYAFYHGWPDDAGANIWFRIGGSSATFYISDVKVEELTLA